jgi:hypothetical protein
MQANFKLQIADCRLSVTGHNLYAVTLNLQFAI